MKSLFLVLLISTSAFAGVFSIKTSLTYLDQVAQTANCIQKNEGFLKEVEVYPKFTFTQKSPKEVAASIKTMKPVIISSYKTTNPWSKAIATTYPTDKTTVYFNTRKNPRAMKAMVNTAFHEGLHLNGFSHGDNSPNGKEDSVNYRVGSIAEKYVDVCNKTVFKNETFYNEVRTAFVFLFNNLYMW